MDTAILQLRVLILVNIWLAMTLVVVRLDVNAENPFMARVHGVYEM